MQDTKTPLVKQAIHDEFGTATYIDDRENDLTVFRQIEIKSEAEYKRKKEILEALNGAQVPDGCEFERVDIESSKEDKLKLALFTRHGAALRVALSKYGKHSMYLGTSGSPLRLLTGQNVVETDSSRVNRLAAKYQCTEFEARSVMGLLMLRKFVRQVLKKDIFTEIEVEEIRERNLTVGSVGFAVYLDFSEKRNDFMHLLGNLVSSTVQVDGETFSLPEFLGVSGKAFRTNEETEEAQEMRQPFSSVLLTKKVNNTIAYKGMLYFKDAEIRAKKDAGLKNAETVEQLTTEEANFLGNRAVRMDCVFLNEGLKAWLNAFKFDYDKNAKNIKLKEVAQMFSNRKYVRGMAAFLGNELKIRNLLVAATVKEILDLKEKSKDADIKELLDIWIQESEDRLSVRRDGRKSKLSWKNPVSEERHLLRAARTLYSEHYIDVSVPYGYHVYLDDARCYLKMSMKERLNASLANWGYHGTGLEKITTADKKRALEQAHKSVRTVRKSLSQWKALPYSRREAAQRLLETTKG